MNTAMKVDQPEQPTPDLASVPTYDDLTAAFVWYERAKNRLESATRAKKSAKEEMDEALASLESLGKKIALAQQRAHGAKDQADRENTVDGQMSLVVVEEPEDAEFRVHDGSTVYGDEPAVPLQLTDGDGVEAEDAGDESESLDEGIADDLYQRQLAHAASKDPGDPPVPAPRKRRG